MRGPPVVLTNTLGRPVTNIISERGAVPMVVVNTLGEPVTLVNSGGEPVTLFNPNGTLWDYPFSLFANAEQGAWYDPSDFSTLFQDSAGSTPVTAVEQPVGLMLDRSGRGNHALQATSASRPVLRARYNLLTYSEELNNAAWQKQAGGTGVAPTVNATPVAGHASGINAFEVTFNTGAGTASGDFSRLFQDNALLSSLLIARTSVVWLRVTTGTAQIEVDIPGTALSIITVSLTTSWQAITVSGTSTVGISGLAFRARGNLTSGSFVVQISAPSLLTAADQTSTGGAYQRIAAATDYDTSNPVFRPYLAFDGVDDSFGTSAIDFSGTDEMTVFAGVTKLSDAALGIVAELSATLGAGNPGSFFLTAPRTAATGDFAFNCGGTAFGTGAVSANSFAAPTTRVMTGIGDISGDVATLRIDGAQVATSATNQDTGNFGNYPLFIGRRNNASLPLNGRLYSLAVLGRTATAAELAAMEAWVNGKTGAF